MQLGMGPMVNLVLEKKNQKLNLHMFNHLGIRTFKRYLLEAVTLG